MVASIVIVRSHSVISGCARTVESPSLGKCRAEKVIRSSVRGRSSLALDASKFSGRGSEEDIETVKGRLRLQEMPIGDDARRRYSFLRSPGSIGGGVSVTGITIISLVVSRTTCPFRKNRASM